MHHHTSKFITVTCLAVAGLLLGSPALAAPHAVTYRSTATTAAVPGKAFPLSFQVKNTDSDSYSNVKVIFHIPDNLEVLRVAPQDARVEDGVVSWSNLHMKAGQSFYPSFTFKVKQGTPIKTKLRIWVEVTGEDMEATSTNFSVTAQSASKAVTSTLSSTDIRTMFELVYGHIPSASEQKYWVGRRTDKPQRNALLGAMMHHKIHNIKH